MTVLEKTTIDLHTLAFNMSPDAISINRLEDGVYVEVNRGFTALSGFRRDEVIGGTPSGLGIWANLDEIETYLKLLKEKQNIVNMEASFRKMDGTTILGLISGKIIYIDGESHVLSVTRDISQLKSAEIKLRNRTLFQERLLETARKLTATLDIKEIFTQIAVFSRDLLDAYSCDVYLLDETETLLKPIVTIDPEFEDEILSTVIDVETSFSGQAVKQRKSLIFNDALDNPLGSQIPGTSVEDQEHVIVSPIIFDDQIHGVVCLNRIGTRFTEDHLEIVEMFALQASTALKNAQMYSVLEKEIKERQEAEKELQSYKIHLEELVEQRTQQLKQSKESLQQERDLFIGGQVAIFKWLDKVDSSIEYVSPNINSILGYTVDELTRGSITYFDLVHEGDRQQIIDEINTAVNSESTYITHSPFRMLTKNKQTVWMQDFTTIIRDNDGSIVHFLGYLVDITEKVQAEEKLKSKQTQLAHSGRLASLGEMATGVAHELNQPLAIIRVQAEVLRLGARMNADSNDPLINDLNEIIGQVDRASAIIDHMRGYARIESENDLEVDLTQPVLSSLSFFREQFKNHCINLITEFDDGLPLLGINHQRFEQVVVNFMSNARYAVDKKGESQTCEYNKEVLVRIINRRALKQVLFEVEDNGIGMSTDEMDRCLEPFYTQKEVGEGTGLGLSIVNSIIREFDGKLEIESEPDKGTLMRIVIPV